MSLAVPPELNGDNWRRAGREMLAKAIAELCYERLLVPAESSGGGYRIDLSSGVCYSFAARRGAFGSWRVESASMQRAAGAAPESAADPLRFLLDARADLGISGTTAGHLVRELSATLAADTRLSERAPGAAAMADLPHAELERHQRGHPWLIPNKGRLGFSASDAERYAPESGAALVLPWIAVHGSLASYHGVGGLDPARLLAEELDTGTRERFTAVLAGRGLVPGEYHWLPIHPWQWDEIVLPVFAAEVAAARIVPLGDGPDRYAPQQSVRTLTNLDVPERGHVKLPLSVLNTLVWRGLPTERTLAAPAVTEWVAGLAAADPFLRDETRPVLLGEVASVTVRHPVLEEIPEVAYQYRELLGAIWREPLTAKLDPGERARTLASLLYVDPDGRALVTELVSRSGMDGGAWLRRLFGALLPPLLHFLYRYGVVFSPHGENTIVVFDSADAPTRLGIKDFVDDVNVSAEPLPELEDMPPEVANVLLTESPEGLCQFIQSGLFVGVFRYLAELCERHLGVAERRFWAMVRAEVLAYQARFPELAERFATFDLLAPELDRLCLNRNRLLLDGYADRPERPHAAAYGRVPNPLHGGASYGEGYRPSGTAAAAS